MTLPDEIDAVQRAIQGGLLSNEAAVSQGAVLRLAGSLGWPTYDTQVVFPEFPLAEGRRVDFALCHPPGKPLVLIEVKQVGHSGGAERQLFEYAFHQGVPMAVLTDGREWHFFLPGEPGDYGDRRVYRLDIVERDVGESSRRLQRYLDYAAVRSGAALRNARADYEDVTRTRQIEAALPEAWQALVEDEDEILLELVADRVESLCGFKPHPDQVARFLAQFPGVPPLLAPRGARVQVAPSQPPVDSVSGAPTSGAAPPGAQAAFVLLGVRSEQRNAKAVLVATMQALSDRDPTFLDRFAALPKHGRTRRYIARERRDLYPGRPDLAQEHAIQLRAGWWLGTNVSKKSIKRIIKLACEVANLHYGVDLTLEL